MSNDFSPINNPETESPMFAGVPSWERGKKRRGFGSRGSRAAAEPRSFAPDEAPMMTPPPATLSEDARAYEARMDTVDPTDTAFASGATFADRTSRKGNGAAPIMVAAGIILVGGLAAAGWYATQGRNPGVAELTPGAASTTTTTEVASTAPLPTEPQQAAPAAAEPAAPVAHTRSVTTTTTTHAPKAVVSHTAIARAAPARSASDAGANASTTAAPPRASAPAPAAPPAAAAPPAPLQLNIPPAQTAPAPQAPAEAPAPTQTAPAPAPTQTPPS